MNQLQCLIDEIESENLKFATEKIKNVTPKVAIIFSNFEDEPSKRYVKAKVEKMRDYGIESTVCEVTTEFQMEEMVEFFNKDKGYTGIIIQAPFGKFIKKETQEVFDLVNPRKDIDRLHSKWVFSNDPANLPLTAFGIYKLINRIDDKIKPIKNILFYGNGLTVNRRLFINMFSKGKYNCTIINSKTPEWAKQENIENSNLIVASTGVPEILECRGKIVLSPTLIKTEKGWRSDLKQECREGHSNITHNVLKAIGKLTVSELLKRAYEDALKIKGGKIQWK